MRALFEPFIQLCLFRTTPQQLPYSPLLLLLVLIANICTTTVHLGMHSFGLPRSLTGGLLESILITALTVSLLWMVHQSARLVQTLTAMIGTNLVIGLLVIPVYAGRHLMVADGLDPGLLDALIDLAVVWTIAIVTNILRHALDASIVVALLVTLVWYWLLLTMFSTLLPLPPASA